MRTHFHGAAIRYKPRERGRRGIPAILATCGICVVVGGGIPRWCRRGAKGLWSGLVAFRDGFAHSHADIEEVGLDRCGQGGAEEGGWRGVNGFGVVEASGEVGAYAGLEGSLVGSFHGGHVDGVMVCRLLVRSSTVCS